MQAAETMKMEQRRGFKLLDQRQLGELAHDVEAVWLFALKECCQCRVDRHSGAGSQKQSLASLRMDLAQNQRPTAQR